MNTKVISLVAGLMVFVAVKNGYAQGWEEGTDGRYGKALESWNYYDDVESNFLSGEIPPVSDPCCVAVPGIPCPKDVPTC